MTALQYFPVPFIISRAVQILPYFKEYLGWARWGWALVILHGQSEIPVTAGLDTQKVKPSDPFLGVPTKSGKLFIQNEIKFLFSFLGEAIIQEKR